MSQQLTLDRESFEQILAAASLLQQLQKQAVRSLGNRAHAQPLLSLVETQQAIQTGALDLEAAMNRIVSLALTLLEARGAAVWLFTENEFVYRAGAGSASIDERLRLEVLSNLATTCDADERHSNGQSSTSVHAAVHFPGAKSLLVAPIYQGPKIAGALAVFSPGVDAFSDADTTNLRLMAGLLAHALDKAAGAELKHNVTLERAAMLKVVRRLVPSLERLIEAEERHRSPRRFSPVPKQADVDAALSGFEPTLEPAEATAEVNPLLVSLDENSSPKDPEVEINVPEQTNSSLPLSEVTMPAGRPDESPPSPVVDDISVPGIGVRAALYDVPESSDFWPAIGEKCRRAVASIVSLSTQAFGGLGRAQAWVLKLGKRAGSRVSSQVRTAAKFRPNLPALSAEAVIRHLRQAQDLALSTAKSAAAQVRNVAKTVSSVPSLPTQEAERHLRRARASVFSAIDGAVELVGRVGNFRPGWRVPRYKLDVRATRRAAGAAVILLVMVAFLFLEMGLHRPPQTAAAGSAVPTRASVAPFGVGGSGVHDKLSTKPQEPVGQPEGASASLVSHLQVTDDRTSTVLEDLSGQEIANLRREYGDPASAFELGMAYEIGRGVPQSCVEAAGWVSRAADKGNAAAEYNLGLRYRDGDGVRANSEEAEKWLRLAAHQRYSHAKQALATLRSNTVRAATP